MDKIEIKFAKHQKLPKGYKVEWWEADEHFHWVIDENTYSCIYSSRWQAYRGAWTHSEHIKRKDVLFDFIKEWKNEFKDENWDYLDFMAERFLNKWLR